MMKKAFRIFAVPLFEDNYSYIVQPGSKQSLMLVDPANPEVIMDCLAKLFPNKSVGHILYTHKHGDHAGGAQDLYKMLSAKDQKLEVYSGAEDAIHIKTVTRQIQGDEQISIGNIQMRVYKVPCHTRGHVVYHLLKNQQKLDEFTVKDELQTSEGKRIRVFEEGECAFSGDTLFSGAIGKFFEGNANEMYTNLKKLKENLDDDCSIFNGHEYTLQALKWATKVEPENEQIKTYITQLQSEDQTTVCSLPTNMAKQSKINVFLRGVINQKNQLGVEGVQYLRILRQAKDKNSAELQKFK